LQIFLLVFFVAGKLCGLALSKLREKDVIATDAILQAAYLVIQYRSEILQSSFKVIIFKNNYIKFKNILLLLISISCQA